MIWKLIQHWFLPMTTNTYSIGIAGLELIKSAEGFRAAPYVCPAGVPTIGYGSTYYPNGKPVKMTDKPISEAEGERILRANIKSFEVAVSTSVTKKITQNQFDALVSLAYNIGITAFKNSTLLKKLNKNPADPTISHEFLRWDKAAGKVMSGLTVRRKKEAALYAK